MKTLITIIQILVIIVIANTSICSQSAGDYRSLITGSWSVASTWETYNGSSWIPAVTPPTGSENITVDDSVNVDVAVNISGYVILSGDGNIEIGTGSLTFGNGSTYEHARISGGIPVSTWSTGSTCKITGITNQAPANRNQSFYNLIWDCPNQSGNFNMGFDEDTIGGDISIINTGASSRLYLCAPAAGDTATVVINGNIIQTGGQFSSNGSGNAAFIEITVNGDITVSGGNFSVSRGSQGGTGTTKWYLHGANFSMTDATTQNSNAAGAKFIFSGTTQQNLSLNNVTFSGGFPIEVAANAILDVGTSQIAGSGIFTLNDGATLQTANVAGLDSTLQNTGIITLSYSGNYGYNGSAAQVTGNLLPVNVNDLTIDNAAGVTLNGTVQVFGILNLLNGNLHLDGNNINIGPTGVLIETPGNTVTGLTGTISVIGDLSAGVPNNVGGLGVMVTSDGNITGMLVNRFHSAATGNGNVGIFRQYFIDYLIDEDIPELAVSVRFYYDESELNSIPEANLRVFHSTDFGNNWVGIGGTVNTTDNYVELTNFNDLFLNFTLADVNNPIPVELTSFTANVVDGLVNLSWTTATELNNSGWDIERRADNDKEGSWVKVGFVKGIGNSTENKQYKFIDQNNVTGKYSYRLKQIDFNGTITYSNIVEISVTGPDKFELSQNYPNPFNPETSIRFEVPSSSFVNISVYNMIGEKVVTLVNENMEQGVYLRKLSSENLSSGIYIYRLTAGSTIITKKMTLLK